MRISNPRKNQPKLKFQSMTILYIKNEEKKSAYGNKYEDKVFDK